ncbi:helix-turn-helix domain-containing protein [Streptomyces sp. SBT349]|uniref:helix-turn-helix domain-containing protein n=1 Tax=Streptomyces sp. SBT349 TaxID=1580539 RepID=UPI0007C691C9|nr:helix-turn-helix domain-containing protein [Streptomyces sp. SBT349]
MPDHTDMPTEGIGARLRETRKRRGLSQKGLAASSGVSVATIRSIEQGTSGAPRMGTFRKLAVVLRVPTSKLAARQEDPVPQLGSGDAWRPVQRAVEQPHISDLLLDEPTVASVEEDLQAARTTYFADDHAALAADLPGLLRNAEALGDENAARELRARTLHFTGAALTQVRQWDAADMALERALDEAPDSATAAGVITTRCWLLMRRGMLAEARELATRWADDLEPRRVSRATPDDLAAWGWLLLHAAAAAVRDNREGEAATAIRMAKGAAVMTGRELGYGRRMNRWGPLVVAHKQVETHIILDQPDKALHLAEGLRKKRKAPPSDGNSNRHRLDVASAHTTLRQYGEAVDVLLDVHATAPSWLANQRYARDILGDIVAKRRTLTPEMRQLADAIGLPM